MSLRVVAAVAGLLGGACWLVRLGVEEAALSHAGLGLVLFGVAVFGLGLVSDRSPLGLRVVVALGFAALAWSVVEVARYAGRDHVVDAVLGAGVLLVALVGLGLASRDGDRSEG